MFVPKTIFFNNSLKVHFEIKPNEMSICVYNVNFAENL